MADEKKSKAIEIDGKKETIQWTEMGKNVEIILKDVRISFAHLFKPQERRNDDGDVTGYNYSINALMSKAERQGKINIELCREAIRRALVLQWGDNPPKIPSERRCLRPGERKDEDTGELYALYDGYEGMIFLVANRGVKSEDTPFPGSLLDSRKGPDGKFPTLKESDGKLYSGCYADIIVRIYGYDGKKKNPDRVNASLEAVKFKRHGEAFGTKAADAQNLFDEEAPEDDDLEMGSSSSNDDDDDLGI